MVRGYKGRYDAYWNRIELEHRDPNLKDGQRIYAVDYIELCRLYAQLEKSPDSAKATFADLLFNRKSLEKVLAGEDL